MKQILITGEKSKLGTSFSQYIRSRYTDDGYQIDFISVRGDQWKDFDFTEFDTILHCAGIFNAPEQDYRYYEDVNVRLTGEIAEKAKKSGVGQFIYLSTMDVYSPGFITKDTLPKPESLYGRSKLEAEHLLQSILNGSGVNLAIIRCCPVIGKHAESRMEGYLKAFKLPVFPLMFTDEKRSILHIDTLCELIKHIIDNDEKGFFFPQNLPPLSVAEILKIIKKEASKKTILLELPKCFWISNRRSRAIFGDFSYSPDLSNHFDGKYMNMDSKEAVRSIFNNSDIS